MKNLKSKKFKRFKGQAWKIMYSRGKINLYACEQNENFLKNK